MSSDFLQAQDRVLLGQIAKPHGIEGKVVMKCFSGQPENMKAYTKLFLIDKKGRVSVPLTVDSCRIHGRNVVLGFEGITRREQTNELLGAEVAAAKATLPPPGKDEFYWHQYEGKAVTTTDGLLLGYVERLFNTGAQDILVIKPEQAESEEELLIPVTREFLVAEEKNRLIVELPPGLLEINQKGQGNAF